MEKNIVLFGQIADSKQFEKSYGEQSQALKSRIDSVINTLSDNFNGLVTAISQDINRIEFKRAD